MEVSRRVEAAAADVGRRAEWRGGQAIEMISNRHGRHLKVELNTSQSTLQDGRGHAGDEEEGHITSFSEAPYITSLRAPCPRLLLLDRCQDL